MTKNLMLRLNIIAVTYYDSSEMQSSLKPDKILLTADMCTLIF